MPNLKFKILNLNKLVVPNKFTMSPVELKDYVDFDVKRVYFISEVQSATGSHCHKQEKEFFIMIAGSCTAVIDQGQGLQEISMAAPTAALYVGSFVWHHFKDFSPGSILLALSSTNYKADRSDYIEDYEVYKKTIKEMFSI